MSFLKLNIANIKQQVEMPIQKASSLYQKTKTYITALSILFLIAGCTGENCIDADDFGHSIVSVGARYSLEELEGQEEGNQVAPWISAKMRVNGKPLAMVVKGWTYGVNKNDENELSAWCPWYGSSLDGKKLSAFCERLPDCQFIDDEMCTETADARILNAPCIFRKGVGLYALIAAKGTDPNKTLATRSNPDGIVMHLGAPTEEYSLFDIDSEGSSNDAGGRVYTYGNDITTQQQYDGSDLYFKILDKFYDDNNGQYRVVVKSGISRSSTDPITYVTMLVKQFLFGARGDGELLLPGLEMSNADGVFDANGNGGVIKNLYLGIVNNAGYRFAVSAILTLYIMFTALSYLAGNIQLTHTELIVRIAKIAIVSALLSSEYSWSFFNDYLFVYFVGGVEQILQIIIEAGATGPGSPGIFAMMIAPQTLSKLFSLLFISWLGWLYIILFMIALYFIIMIFFKAAVIYLSALIAIGIIIIMGPIFICFLLFGITRSLFENWMKQLISYALQPIILFAGLTFISIILRQEIYGALGFRICKQGFPQLSSTGPVLGDSTSSKLGFNPGNTIFYWWFPKPIDGEDLCNKLENIPIPIDHFAHDDETGDISASGFCEAYGCIGERYEGLPFLHPDDDRDRINSFCSGNFVHLKGLLLIFVTLYLLHKFNDSAVNMAKGISGTAGNLTNIQNVGDTITASTFGKANSYMASMPGRMKSGAVDYLDRQIGRRAIKASGIDTSHKSQGQIRALEKTYGKAARLEYSPSSLVDKARIRSLKRESLTEAANKSVLAAVKRDFGLKKSDIDPDSIQKYREELSKNLMDMGFDKAESKKLSKKMSKKNLSELKGELSKAKFGKSYDKLSQKEEAYIKNIYGNGELRKLAIDSAKARRFRTAYANSYAKMSDKSIGILGKNSSVVRKIDEVLHDSKESKNRSEAKRVQRGEKILSAYEDIKHGDFSFSGEKGYGRGINTGDSRKMTYGEELSERSEGLKEEKLSRIIEEYNKRYGESVISPEFLSKAERANHPKLEQFKNLERERAKIELEAMLKFGDNPVIKGDSYMRKHAKDSEMREMIDQAYKVQEDFYQDNEFISRSEEYEMTYDLAKDNIEKEYQELVQYYGRDDIKAKEMPDLMEKMYKENAQMNAEEDAPKRIQQLKQSFEDYSSSKSLLGQIDQRKAEVSKQIASNVDKINEYRASAGMQEYRPKTTIQRPREVLDIDKAKRLYKK